MFLFYSSPQLLANEICAPLGTYVRLRSWNKVGCQHPHFLFYFDFQHSLAFDSTTTRIQCGNDMTFPKEMQYDLRLSWCVTLSQQFAQLLMDLKCQSLLILSNLTQCSISVLPWVLRSMLENTLRTVWPFVSNVHDLVWKLGTMYDFQVGNINSPLILLVSNQQS